MAVIKPAQPRTTRTHTILAFAAIYLIWGSTYLAIRYAIETLPPFFMMGSRSLVAGALLYTWARARGVRRPSPGQWATASMIGGFLFLGGHGALAWGEERIPSGVAALTMATTPICMGLLQVATEGVRSVTGRMVFGLVLGISGVALLVGPAAPFRGAPADLTGVFILLLGALSWSVGSIYSRGRRLPDSACLAAAMNLLTGGALLLLFSRLMGETVQTEAVTARSLLAWLYLVTLGSVVAFAAYIRLLRVCSPTKVSTYAFVNPAIAVVLGWAIAGEALGPRTVVATVMLVTAVAAVVTGSNSRASHRRASLYRSQDSSTVDWTPVLNSRRSS